MTTTSIDDLRFRMPGGLHEPGDSYYEESRTLFNTMIDRRPRYVAECLSVDDVVAALHTVSAPILGDLERELDEDVLIAGDSKAAKLRAAEIVRRIPGLRPVDAGRLEQARHIEAITPLLISVNARNKTHAGIKLTGLGEPRW